MTTLFEKLGGRNAIDLAVDRFYNRILNDDRIKHFFENVDMNQQRKHQKAFLTYAFGGTPQYQGRKMQQAHKRLVEEMNLSDEHFDAVIENLVETLKELNISDDLIQQVGAIVANPDLKKNVLNRSA
jgi:hemoglobin